MTTPVPPEWLDNAITVEVILDEARHLGLPLHCPDCPGRLALLPGGDEVNWAVVLPHDLACPVANRVTAYRQEPTP